MVGHPIILRGLRLPGLEGEGKAPTVLSIAEQDFLPWFLSRLETEPGQGELSPRDAFKRLNAEDEARFFQPVHRSFNIVVVEVACEVEGQPRLDPRKILRAGVTLRRRVPPPDDLVKKRSVSGARALRQVAPKTEALDVYRSYAPGLYGWMKQEGRVLGWRPANPTAHDRFAPDPNPAFRESARQGKNARVLRQGGGLPTPEAAYEEDFMPLTPAPEEICRKIGKTVLFGYLPVTSQERSEADGPPEAPFDRSVVEDRLPFIFWSGARIKEADEEDLPANPPRDSVIQTSTTANPGASLQTLLNALSYLAQEPGLFLDSQGEDNPAEDLRALLAKKTVTRHNEDESTDFLTFLTEANVALVERNPEVTSIRIPEVWPSFTATEEAELVDAIHAAIAGRWAELSPGETRFQNMEARYEVQAFVRVDRSDCGCPPQTVWTAPSGPIEIVPWYEGGEAPPPIVELPAPSALKGKISPNIAFKVPEEIQKFMSGIKLDKLMEGEQPETKWGIGMICGFSIPIITICAFIVLQIFLVLFHILFWWLPFIRICIPFPKKES